jgi:carboxyl-terminal processing protease
MFKRTFIGLMGLMIFMSFTPLTAAHEYEDVPRDSVYYYPIDYLRRNDVFQDTKEFHPDLLISKAEFVKYLVTLNSPEFQPQSSAKLPFADTRDNAWYASYFEEAIDLGILDDREENAEPNKKLTVIDALTLLFHSQSIPIPNVYKGNIPYTDVQRNKAVAPLIMRSLQLDLIQPEATDNVGIYQRVTRAQAARMIYKLDLATLGTPTSSGLPGIESYSTELQKLISVWELIESSYYKKQEIDTTALVDNAIHSMVEGLDDPYSSYLDEEENTEFFDNMDGEIEGIGAVLGYNDKEEITIVSPIKDAPADKAGLKAGDVIYSVDDTNIEGMDLTNIVNLIKGEKGTTVELGIRRKGKSSTYTITRDIVSIPSLEYETIEGGKVMLVNFYQFGFQSAEQFDEVVETVKADSRIKGMIVDLRDNPGGLLDAVVRILGHIVKTNEEVVKVNYTGYSQTLLSRGDAELNDFPIVLLINGGSASASEIMAGALQDHELATIVGDRSFGKGTVQEINYFYDNSSLKLTIARWLTPGNQEIQEDGITPDIAIADDENTPEDEQMEEALNQLNKLMR